MRRRRTKSKPRSRVVHPVPCARAGSGFRSRGDSSRSRSVRPQTDRCSSQAACAFSTRTEPFSTRVSGLRSDGVGNRETSPCATARTRRSALVPRAVARAEVVDSPQASRYELRLGGRVIDFAAYRRRNDRIVFIHTEVDESYEGRGLGNRLAEAALEDVRGKGLVVVPLCPFIARYIQQRPEYQELVATS